MISVQFTYSTSTPQTNQINRREAVELYLSSCRTPGRYWNEVARTFRNQILPGTEEAKPVVTWSKQEFRHYLNSYKDRPGALRLQYSMIHSFLEWLTQEELINANPLSGMRAPPPVDSRDRVLTTDELRKVIQAFKKLAYPWGPYYSLLATVGQRRNEVAGMNLSEIEIVNGQAVWVIPATRTKSKRLHVVPLSTPALRIISQIGKRPKGLLFTYREPFNQISGFTKAKRDLDLICGVTNWRVHDLRRTMATKMTGELKINRIVVSKVLNHALPGVTTIYDRYEYFEEKRQALDAWAQYLEFL